MGCDFMTWVQTYIEYKDLSTNEIKIYVELVHPKNIERHYGYFGYENTYDPDFESPPEHPMFQMINDYGKRLMFENGKWLCNSHGESSVHLLCEENNIPFDNIVCVYKRMDGSSSYYNNTRPK